MISEIQHRNLSTIHSIWSKRIFISIWPIPSFVFSQGRKPIPAQLISKSSPSGYLVLISYGIYGYSDKALDFRRWTMKYAKHFNNRLMFNYHQENNDMEEMKLRSEIDTIWFNTLVFHVPCQRWLAKTLLNELLLRGAGTRYY